MSLERDALETALETLAGLQQDGKLIGLTSHVAALKERIGAQIQVIPETGGRSVRVICDAKAASSGLKRTRRISSKAFDGGAPEGWASRSSRSFS